LLGAFRRVDPVEANARRADLQRVAVHNACLPSEDCIASERPHWAVRNSRPAVTRNNAVMLARTRRPYRTNLRCPSDICQLTPRAPGRGPPREPG
jgi:hypothetical protein